MKKFETKDLIHYYNKLKYGEDTFHNLMQYRIRDILLVSTFYDAFILEQDGHLSDKLFGEYQQLDLSLYPKIVTTPSAEEAIKLVQEQKFDLVITLENVGRISSVDLAREIKALDKELPILLLLNQTVNPLYFEQNSEYGELFDGIFCWEGDAKIFLTMVKLTEDKRNLKHDTEVGLTRVILLYEKSIKYYSKFLPLIYYELVRQTQRLIKEELNDINKRLRMRARPKVILVHSLEEALKIYDEFKNYITCVISAENSIVEKKPHLCYKINGLKLFKKIRENDQRTSLMLHSSDQSIIRDALDDSIYYLYEGSSAFWRDFRNFLHTSQGFGDFVFRDQTGKIIDTAASMREFEQKLKTISDDSLKFHSDLNHFSAWLIAHGEFQVARVIAPKKIEDFPDIKNLRDYLIAVFQYVNRQKNRGKIVSFNEDSLTDEKQIVRLSEGSLGGKGRGLAFLNALMETMEFDDYFPDIHIKLPCTAIICTDEFDSFIERNKLNLDFTKYSDYEIDRMFVEAQLSDELMSRLRIYLNIIRKPIAVRSSGLLEDSQSQPFAGVYRTFMLPNNHPDDEIRLLRLCNAIKLIFASIYLKNTRNYIEGINFKIEEEKMAVILQTVVGKQYNSYYYPHFSGVAQSYNYYPTSYMKHNDGIVSLAVGLGKSVVDREKSYSFCPRYPRIEFMPPFRVVEYSQSHFYAINLQSNELDLVKGEEESLVKKKIENNEKEGPLINVTSIWDYENNAFLEGTFVKGPRVITFRSITHFNLIPLSDILNLILQIGEKAMGIPVEIEFAVNLEEDPSDEDEKQLPAFYLLQIRPLNVSKERLSIDLNSIDKKESLLFSSCALGNGVIDGIHDLIYLVPDLFDNSKTLQMRDEIEFLNETLRKENRYYILIGPGRWGSSDRFLGIPVKWAQINRAKVIVEVGLKNFIVEASQGSHFFQNVFAMNVGYFTIPYSENSINWIWLNKQKIHQKTDHFIHLRSNNPFLTKIDGRKGAAIIFKPQGGGKK
ncbi:MAG: hypothetical protein K0B81_07885 [Candidatus Cloacimonetes bacterium]|nr:hypothetical protein [Candidatus Cloacimonadota bacterium]